MSRKILFPTIFLMAVGIFSSIDFSIAQSSITIDASQQITNFVFTDGTGLRENTYLVFGENNDYKPVYSGAYNVGYSYLFDFGLFLRGSVGMRNAGASMVYDAANYLWSFQYLQTKIGTGYAYELGRFSPYFVVSGFYGYLVKANQRINNEDFDIIDSESIKKHDLGMYFSPGVRLDASDYISVYSEISYLMGLKNIETAENGQKAVNVGYAITLGLSFAIK